MEQEKMHQCHQPARAIFFDSILILHRKKLPAIAIFVNSIGDLGDLIPSFAKNVEHHLLGASPPLFNLDAKFALVIKPLLTPMISPHTEPSLQNAYGDLDGFSMLRLRRLAAHRRGCQRWPACRAAKSIRPWSADKRLRILRRIVGQPKRALYQSDETEHTFFFQSTRQAAVHQRLG